MATVNSGRINSSDESVIQDYSIDAGVSTTIKTAGNDFIFWSVTNNSNREIWIKLQAASVDNDAKGIRIQRNGGYWEMPPDNIYTGEISAQSNQGNNKEIFTNQY